MALAEVTKDALYHVPVEFVRISVTCAQMKFAEQPLVNYKAIQSIKL